LGLPPLEKYPVGFINKHKVTPRLAFYRKSKKKKEKRKYEDRINRGHQKRKKNAFRKSSFRKQVKTRGTRPYLSKVRSVDSCK